jgi:hypothetical protein
VLRSFISSAKLILRFTPGREFGRDPFRDERPLTGRDTDERLPRDFEMELALEGLMGLSIVVDETGRGRMIGV